ncbi:hypothetical protein EDB84DRAFT_624816 [Lactarius hengduanensis]|nr:hypothetical protein EDB84DRAFT_624816 [Lactarius hengduanensis]
MMRPSMAQYDIFRDQLAIKYPTYGHALWEPNPGGLYHAIEVGDVGCILKGKFLRLFNILLPADHPSHQKSGVPESHEPLKPSIVDHIDSGTPGPEKFCSVGVTESAALANSQTSVLDPEGHVEVSFSCTKSRGAALFLPVRAQREDTVARGDFAEWMVKHVDSWFSFAKTLDLGIESIRMEDIILVTGRHRTRSWTNVAFIESQGLVQKQVAFGVHVSGSPPSHISVDWKSPRELGQGVASNMGPSGEDLSENQCVFIRGFRVTHTRLVLNWFRDTARSTSGLNQNRDKSKPARQQTSESTPTVTYRDPLSSLLEYIASQDPHSDMVLVHDDDLARFHEISDVSRDVVLARLRDVQPKIQQVFSGSPSANNGQRVAMFSKERAKSEY